MIYTVEEHTDRGIKTQTYEGFMKCFEHENCPHELQLPPKGAKFLGLILWEDSISPWWLENDGMALEELQRMYRSLPGVEAKVCLIPITSIERST